MGRQRKRRRADHRGTMMVEGHWRVAERTRGRVRIGGSEPCRACEKGEGWMGSTNLLERKRKRKRRRKRREVSSLNPVGDPNY